MIATAIPLPTILEEKVKRFGVQPDCYGRTLLDGLAVGRAAELCGSTTGTLAVPHGIDRRERHTVWDQLNLTPGPSA